MSELNRQLRALAASCVDGGIPADDFRSGFAGLYFQIRQSAPRDREANLLASKIIGPLAEFSRGNRDEGSFRQELAAAIRPSALAPSVAVIPAHSGTIEVYQRAVPRSFEFQTPVPPSEQVLPFQMRIFHVHASGNENSFSPEYRYAFPLRYDHQGNEYVLPMPPQMESGNSAGTRIIEFASSAWTGSSNASPWGRPQVSQRT